MKAARPSLKDSPWLPLAPLALFVVLRFNLLGHLVYGNYAQVAAYPFGEENISKHPIFAVGLYRAWFLLFGWENLRWAPFLFSLGVFGLTWRSAKRLLGGRGALLACLLLAVTPASLFGSSQIYIDGAILPFFLMAFYCLYEPLSRSPDFSPSRLALCGAAYGLMWLSKYSALPILASFALHSLFMRGLKATLRDFSLIFLCGAAVFLPYPLLLPAHYAQASGKIGLALSTLLAAKANTPASTFANSFAKAFLFMGPLPLGALALASLQGRHRRELSLPLCVCLAYMGAIFVLLNPHNTVQYWMPIAPLLCLVAAKIMDDWLDPGLKDVLLWSCLGAALLALLTVAGPSRVRPIHPLSLSWAALREFLPIRLYLGPSPALYLKPAAALLAFGACLAGLALGRAWPALRRPAIAAGLAYGLFYSLEYGWQALSPSVDRAAKQVVASLRQEPPAPPLYVHGLGEMNLELAGLSARYFTYDAGYIPSLVRTMEKTKGSVVLIESAAIGEETELKRFLRSRASLERSFLDRGMVMAEVFRLR